MNIKMSLLKQNDCQELALMVQEVFRKSFKYFYPQSWIDEASSRQTAERFWQKAQIMHFYVAKNGKKIVGCGAVSPYFEKRDECVIVSFYVSSKYQGKGVGKKIMSHLMQDEIFKRSKRVEVASSLNAVPFYMKHGFRHKNNQMVFDDGSLCLEFFR